MRVTAVGTQTGTAAATAATAPAAESEDLAAPLYVAWQITNECNLACLHCIEESGPGKAFADELGEAQIFAILDQLMKHEVPYLSFSGGASPIVFQNGGVRLRARRTAQDRDQRTLSER
jgi:hypothetical protein